MKIHIPKWLITTIIILAIIGFCDATFLTVEHYLGLTPPCSIVSGCEKVTTSEYNQIMGIPVALLGSLFYAFTIVMSILFIDLKKDIYFKLLFLASSLAFLFSIWFVYAQIFLIESICIYCMLSALSSSAIFGLSIHGMKKSLVDREIPKI